ncbi:DinB family protein [Acinetobacter bohemicus]|uniref:DinB family protein n=1 Tax=Acinetobacter bohemicus TaxID=1435036 RepID=A0A1I6U847_9GAMM|nr:DinB family protein [Acinetobacter bohemicus]
MNYSFKTYFLMLAHYNQWANQKLFSILTTLTEEQLNQDCGAYFKSLMQTANHLLVGDLLWFERIKGAVASNYALDEILYPQIMSLIPARFEHDQRLIGFLNEYDEAAFNRLITYIRRG